ncbi:ABC transporter ATP-binding protein [Nitratireductor aestuarii]|uniref:ABC transporter ATP-binding protein n=1 Tax=Nitratireductor aestuarii TaxID=1735103 RepID=A0A916RQU4_9HYPH|nr:sugar ABC transporter ATP-binding protein [Nitratireductor aestuarii]GGA62802.1 ABC transporter ATP-binding protein [Nitratireductor aestuarii]
MSALPDKPAALEVKDVRRSFGPVEVLHGVDLALHSGEVHALIGENGAGKSTIMKIMAGYLTPTSGEVLLNGKPVTFASSEEAENKGVILIHQEFNLAEQLTVEENIFLGRELKRGFFLDKKAMRAEAARLLNELETRVSPDARVSDISVSDKQMVEIAKALSRNARVLIMDEPTAVLTTREAEVLFRQIERLKAKGTAILYTSHKLDEVARIADRITVFRDGSRVVVANTGEMTEDQMAQAMVGRELSNLFPPKVIPANAETVLSVKDFSVGSIVTNASFDLKRGEILGFAGLVGAGRTELMEGLIGVRQSAGQVEINGNPVSISTVSDARRAGVVYLTEDRKGRGLLLRKSMRENLTLLALNRFGRLAIDSKGEDKALGKAISEFDIRAPNRAVLVGNLSGGNQQKLLLAKTMLAEPEIVIIDEPTRGIDIGTKQQIYNFIQNLAASGKSIIMISSEMAEVIGLSHRVVVMRSGRVTGVLSGDEINEDLIVRHAMGLEGKVAA